MTDINALDTLILEAATNKTNPGGNTYRSLSLADSIKLAQNAKTSRRMVELTALKKDVVPERYERSMGTLGLSGQIKLLEARVGVIGAGGLGGFILELLARMGVGTLVIVDGDCFADSNLNRQLLGLEGNIGSSKVEAAAERIARVNGATEVIACHCRGDLSNLPDIFKGCDLVIDCLDNLSSRFDLEKACAQLNTMMIHGAIAGFLGQIAVIRPQKPMMAAIYGEMPAEGSGRGVEVKLGNPSFTPAMLASWQAGEAVKILAGLEGVLPEGVLLIIDMQSGESYRVELSA